MTGCQRFESEGLARFVAGQPLEPHFDSCADCRVARASYEAVAEALKQAREAYAPAGDWEAKVWARIQRGESARRRFLWPAFLGVAATFTAIALILVGPTGGPSALMLSYNVKRGSQPMVRGDTAAPGDIVHLVALVPRGKKGDIRVYRGTNELVFQCATSPSCIRSKDSLAANVSLDRAGTYRIITVAADTELPAASGSLDADYAAAMRSGTARESPPVEVR